MLALSRRVPALVCGGVGGCVGVLVCAVPACHDGRACVNV